METAQAQVERIQEAAGLGMVSGSLAVMETVELTGTNSENLPIVTMNGCNNPGYPCPAACGQAGHCVV